MSESSKNFKSSKLSGIYLKYRQRHLDEGYINGKNYPFENSRRAYILLKTSMNQRNVWK